MNLINRIRKVLSGNATKFDRAWVNWELISNSNLTKFEDNEYLSDMGPEEMGSAIAPSYEGLLKIMKIYRDQNRRSKRIRITTILCVSSFALFVILMIPDKNNHKDYVRFDDTLIRNVFDVFEDRYGIIIEAADTGIMNCRFTGTFSNVGTYEMTISIANSLGLGFEEVEKKRYRLTGSSCI